MTKPKSKNAEPRFSAQSYLLTDEVRAQLIELLGNKGAAAIPEVEKTLGLGHYGAHHLDEIPRPADYVAAFSRLEKEALSLFNSLCELGGYYSEQFAKRGADQDAIEAALIELQRVANGVVNEFKGQPSKGARQNNALAEVVRRLRRTFREYYGGPVDKRRKSGALSYRTDAEKCERKFVKVALRDARLIPVNYTGLEALFLDPRCTLPEERDQTIARIANKFQSRRKKEGN